MQLEPLAGLQVLDLYAGTGALGIEALSRGAAHVTFVDRSPRSLAAIRANLRSLELADRSAVEKADVPAILRRWRQAEPRAGQSSAFDLVFADPPYEPAAQPRPDSMGRLLALLVQSGRLAPAGLVVVETAKRHAVPSVAGLVDGGARVFGDTRITWLRAERDNKKPRSDESHEPP